MSDMTILEQWRSVAYNQNADKNKLQRWATYFNIEKTFTSSFWRTRMRLFPELLKSLLRNTVRML